VTQMRVLSLAARATSQGVFSLDGDRSAFALRVSPCQIFSDSMSECAILHIIRAHLIGCILLLASPLARR
jgi:hypothetical protein